MMPLIVGVIAGRANLNGVYSVSASAAVPEDPQTKSIIEIEIEIVCSLIGIERQRAYAIGIAALFPEIESEIASAEIPIVAVGYRDTVVRSVEREGLAYFARRERCIINSSVVIVLTIGCVTFAFPPCDHPSGRRRAGGWDFKS